MKNFSNSNSRVISSNRRCSYICKRGENAGQKLNRFGDYKEIVLPNSKLRIACSFKYFELMPDTNIDVIEPDIKIPVTIDDYIK